VTDSVMSRTPTLIRPGEDLYLSGGRGGGGVLYTYGDSDVLLFDIYPVDFCRHLVGKTEKCLSL